MFYFKKIISYFDYYEFGEKKRNCGHGRILVKDEKVTIEIHIKGLGTKENHICDIRTTDEEEKKLGKVTLNKGTGHYNACFNIDNVNGSGLCIFNMTGIRIVIDDNRYCETDWEWGELPEKYAKLQTTGGSRAEASGWKTRKERTEVPAKETRKEKTEIPAGQTWKERTETPAEETQKKKTEVPAEEMRKEKAEVPVEETQKKKAEVPAEEMRKEKAEVPAEEMRKEKAEVPAEEMQKKKTKVPTEEPWKLMWEVPAEEIQKEKAEIPAEEIRKEKTEIPVGGVWKVRTETPPEEARTGWLGATAEGVIKEKQNPENRQNVIKEIGKPETKPIKEEGAGLIKEEAVEEEKTWYPKILPGGEGSPGIRTQQPKGVKSPETWPGKENEAEEIKIRQPEENVNFLNITVKEKITDRPKQEAAEPQKAIFPDSEQRNRKENDAVLHKTQMEEKEIRMWDQAEPEEIPLQKMLYDDKWKQLCCLYPVCHPFGEEEAYISIAPKDFVILRKEYQNLVSNSFLLHSFYNYHHLILGKTGDKSDEMFYIGVPGAYLEREKRVAVMFGFEGFALSERGNRKRSAAGKGNSNQIENGAFGYYMRKVEI